MSLLDALGEKAEKLVAPVIDGMPYEFILAGGCLWPGPVNDLDLFPVKLDNFKPHCEAKLVCSTKNADTYKHKGRVLQFCKYLKPLNVLVQSFDFSHIQAGVKLRAGKTEDVFYTDAFAGSLISQSTQYLGSDYPLSSLIRSYKYVYRDLLNPTRAVLEILPDIVDRGFKGYTDFKDQLDAIDLNIIPEDLGDLKECQGSLFKLFQQLRTDAEQGNRHNDLY